jgi:hypothetical protein
MLKVMIGTKAGVRAAVVLLLVGAAAGVAGAQVASALMPAQFIASGLFNLREGETAEFNVSLDDRASAPDSTVTMRLYDTAGTVVARRTVTLAPGQSATLRHRVAGRYRAQAEVADPSGAFSTRRVVASTVEISRVDDLFFSRFVCGPGDNIYIPHK